MKVCISNTGLCGRD